MPSPDPGNHHGDWHEESRDGDAEPSEQTPEQELDECRGLSAARLARGDVRQRGPAHPPVPVTVVITDDELVLSKNGNLVEVEVDSAAMAPRAIPAVVPVIEPTVPMVVIVLTSTATVVITIRPIVVPDQVPNQTTEAALACAVASITIKHIEQVVEHGEPLSSLRSWVHKNSGRIQTDEPGSGQARRVSRFCRRSVYARTDDGRSAPNPGRGLLPLLGTSVPRGGRRLLPPDSSTASQFLTGLKGALGGRLSEADDRSNQPIHGLTQCSRHGRISLNSRSPHGHRDGRRLIEEEVRMDVPPRLAATMRGRRGDLWLEA